MKGRTAPRPPRPPAGWTTVEAGESLTAALSANGHCVLLDGLGPWVAARLPFTEPDRLPAAAAAVLAEVRRAAETAAAGTAIVVAEQAGEGLLPTDPGARAWLDLLGGATEGFAAAAERVVLVTAGRAVTMEGAPAGAHAPARQDAAPGHDAA